MKVVQFPPEAVREMAQLLRETDLGEVTFEAAKGARITLKRTAKLAAPAPETPVAEVEVAPETVPPEVETAPEVEMMLVTAPCVGIFHAAKEVVEVGSRLANKQLVGTVESLKVPNEIYAPRARRSGPGLGQRRAGRRVGPAAF